MSVVTRTVSTRETFTSPQKTTITKTVVTEKEETYKKEEIITYSGSGKPSDILASIRDNDDAMSADLRAKLRQLGATTSEFSSPRKSASHAADDQVAKKVDFKLKHGLRDEKDEEEEERVGSSSRYRTTTTSTTPARDGSSKWSSSKTTTTSSLYATPSNRTATTATSNNSAAVSELPRTATEEDNSEDRFAGRKARLASLANKFRDMDDDIRHFTPIKGDHVLTTSASPATAAAVPRARAHSPVKMDHLRSRSPVKEPAVRSNAMQFISPATIMAPDASSVRPMTMRAASPVKTVRAVSPTKFVVGSANQESPLRSKPVTADESLVSSLKAQGFTESESASKLVYSFKEKKEEAGAGRRANRSPSPQSYRKSLHQVNEEEEDVEASSRGRSPLKRTPTVLSSPTKTVLAPTRSVSPSKPHPLQFVSPQVAAAAAAAPVAPPPPPPKPSRTYETPQAAPSAAPVARSWKMQVETRTPAVNAAAATAESDDRCDTPVLKTVSQKRSMFESRRPASPPPVDPALMSLTERKALFEKNKSVPTPVARFGESVTPAMLAANASRVAPASERGGANAEAAWRRNKRELSPSKQMPSAKRPSPESYVASASKVRRSPEKKEVVEYAAVAKKVAPAVPPKTPASMRKPAEMVDPSPSTPQLGRKVQSLL